MGLLQWKIQYIFTPLRNIYQLTHYYCEKADYHGSKAYWQNMLALVSKYTW